MEATGDRVAAPDGPLSDPGRMSECAAPIDPSVAAGWLAAIERSQFVLELDPDGTIVRVNALLCAALGYGEAELVGRPHRELIVPGTNASAGEPHRTLAYRTRDGGQVVVRASVTPIVGDDDRPARSLVLGIDVSDRSDLHAALARQRRASRPERDLPDGALPTRADLAARLLDLLDRVIGSGGDRARAPDPPLAVAAIADEVRACAEAMRPAAEEKGLVLRCEVDPDLPDLVECDPLRLRQIMFHLIGNAVRFTAKGWISVCAEPAWDDPRILAISVTDTGNGLTGAEAAAASAADPFAASPDGAPGLGLAVGTGIALQMGGTLSHASERGKGTRAELRMPLRPIGDAQGPRGGTFGFPG